MFRPRSLELNLVQDGGRQRHFCTVLDISQNYIPLLCCSMAHWKEDEIFADKLARLCCDHFNKLNKKGKPQIDGEWTLLAAIVLVQQRG